MTLTEDPGEWQTVKPKDKHRKPRESSTRLPPTSVGLPSAITAFAALDNRQDQNEKLSEVGGGAPNDGSSERMTKDAKAGHGRPGDPLYLAKESKSKKPKVKKLTSNDYSTSLLEADAFRATLKSIREEHKYQEAMQLNKLLDLFRKSFKDNELQFNKLVTEGPLDQVIDIPWRECPADIASASSEFLKGIETRPLAKFLVELLEEFFEGIPLNAGKGTIPQAKVGLLLTISVILRANAACLFEISDTILEKGDAWAGLSRLPFLFWVFEQADRATPGMAVAMWVRAILPSFLGSHLPTTKGKSVWHKDCPITKMTDGARQKALSYIDGKLDSSASALRKPGSLHRPSKSHSKEAGNVMLSVRCGVPAVSSLEGSAVSGLAHQDGTQRIIHPLIPPGAIEAILRSCFLTPGGLSKTDKKLAELYPLLQRLAMQGIQKGGYNAEEHLKLSLETASRVSDPPSNGIGSPVIDLVAQNVMQCLQEAPSLTSCWEQRHKLPTCLKGSTRVLQHLTRRVDYLSVFEGDLAQRKRLCEMLQVTYSKSSRLKVWLFAL
eukprot:jgi/Botrbrau1/13226/Bobra.9_1s0015.2